MCDLILVNLLKMRPCYSQSSRKNATPSGGTSPLASYKEVPAPPAVVELSVWKLIDTLTPGFSWETAKLKMSCDHGLTVAFAVCSLQFTFERQEELPAGSDGKQHGSTEPAMNILLKCEIPATWNCKLQFALFHEKLHDKFFLCSFYAFHIDGFIVSQYVIHLRV